VGGLTIRGSPIRSSSIRDPQPAPTLCVAVSIHFNNGGLLRRIVQETPALAYVFAGSIVGLVMELLGPGGPFNDGLLAPGKPFRVSDPFFAAWVRGT
jgi:hypothetical protein